MISKKELYFYALILALMPVVVVLSGQATVPILALFSIIPLIKFATSPELNLQDLVISKNKNINYLNLTICILLVFYAIFSEAISANFGLLLRILAMIIACKALYLYLPNLDKKNKTFLKHSLELGFFLAVLLFIFEFNSKAEIAGFLSEALPFERVKHGTKQLFTMNRGAVFLTLIFWCLIAANQRNVK